LYFVKIKYFKDNKGTKPLEFIDVNFFDRNIIDQVTAME
jgi:hypothetical protein